MDTDIDEEFVVDLMNELGAAGIKHLVSGGRVVPFSWNNLEVANAILKAVESAGLAIVHTETGMFFEPGSDEEEQEPNLS